MWKLLTYWFVFCPNYDGLETPYPHKPEWHCNKSTWSEKSIFCCVVVRFWPFFSRLLFFLHIKNDSGVITYRGSKNGHIRRNGVLVKTFDFFCRQTVAQSLLDIRASNRLTKRIQDNLGFWIPLRGFRIPGTGFLSVELRFWIPIVSGIPDSLSCIPDSKAQDYGFHKQKFLGFRNPDFRFKIPFSNVINLNVF